MKQASSLLVVATLVFSSLAATASTTNAGGPPKTNGNGVVKKRSSPADRLSRKVTNGTPSEGVGKLQSEFGKNVTGFSTQVSQPQTERFDLTIRQDLAFKNGPWKTKDLRFFSKSKRRAQHSHDRTESVIPSEFGERHLTIDQSVTVGDDRISPSTTYSQYRLLRYMQDGLMIRYIDEKQVVTDGNQNFLGAKNPQLSVFMTADRSSSELRFYENGAKPKLFASGSSRELFLSKLSTLSDHRSMAKFSTLMKQAVEEARNEPQE